MINFESIKKLPPEISRLLKSKREFIIKEMKEEIKFQESIEKYYSSYKTPVIDDTKRLIKEYFINKTFKCYHCTNIIDKNILLKQGLLPLKIIDYKNHVLFSIDSFLDVKQKSILSEKFDTYIDGKNGVREGLIWFVSNYKMTKSKGCKDFHKFFGGEITRKLIAGFEKDFLPILKKAGKSITIECQIDFKDIKDSHFDNIIDSIINALIYNESIDFEFYIKRDLPPNRIIKIYENN